MNRFGLDPDSPYSLTRITEAWRNRRGIATLFATYLLVALVWGIAAGSGSVGMAGLGFVISWLIAMMGITAAGMQFMQQAEQRPVGGTFEMLGESFAVLARMIGLGLAVNAALMIALVLATVLLYFCKLPLFGPLLLAVLIPVLSFGFALMLVALYLAATLAAPALWEGHTLRRAIAHIWAIASDKPFEALLHLAGLLLVVVLVGGLLGALVFTGYGVAGGLSLAVLGRDVAVDAGAYGSGFPVSGFGGLANGAMAGTAIVMATLLSAVSAVGLLGLSLTYLRLAQGLDLDAAEHSMGQALATARARAQRAADEARRKAREAQDAARRRIEQSRAAAAATGDGDGEGTAAAAGSVAAAGAVAASGAVAAAAHGTAAAPSNAATDVATAGIGPVDAAAPTMPAVSVASQVVATHADSTAAVDASAAACAAVADGTEASTGATIETPTAAQIGTPTGASTRSDAAAPGECPACHARIGAQDTVCASCGHRLADQPPST